MLHDLRRKLISILDTDEACTDAQLLERARYVMRVNATLWDLLSRSHTPVVKPWAAVQIGDYVLEREGLALWTVIGRSGHRLTMVDPHGMEKDVVRAPEHPVHVFEPSPLANGAEILAAELGARYAGVGE